MQDKQPLRWLSTSGLRRFGLFWGISRWFPTLKLGGPKDDDVVVAIGTPVDSFTLVFESVTTNVFVAPPSVNVAKIKELKIKCFRN